MTIHSVFVILIINTTNYLKLKEFTMLKQITLAFLAILTLSGCKTGSRSSTENNAAVLETAHESSLAAEFEKHAGDKVFFHFNKSDVSAKAKETLHKQAEWLKKHSTVKATIAGHCDDRGTREYNLALGERRATAVQNFLLTQGIEAHRLDTISYGKEKPAVVGNDEAAWSHNRRAVTEVK